jgi:hypothetical protein
VSASHRGQVRALLSLRWRMVRSRRVRVGLTVLGVVSLALVVAGIAAGAGAPLGHLSGADPTAGDLLAASGPVDRTGEVAVLLPSAMLAFALFSVIAPVTAGGGVELIPESELVAYPVRVRTLVRLSLILTPLNIAWYFQIIVLMSATAYALRTPISPLLPLGVLVAFLAAATTIGQSVGWAIVGVRRTRRGRIGSWLVLGTGLALGAWVILTDRGTRLLDNAPTRRVLEAQLAAARGDVAALPPVAVLLVAAVVGYLVSLRLASWALRRPGDIGFDGATSRPVRRREPARDEARAVRRVDRASVWRSAPLRRGLLVLAVLPVGAAVVASLPWSSIALLPPLVASGAALLFGVNALSLDGSGAVWVATLPHDPVLVLRSKARVVIEVVGGAVLLVLVGSAVRASDPPTVQALLCVLGASISCTAVVVATCMRLSVRRPHRAELRSPRDTPAPPGTMAVYSARLAAVTTLIGLIFSVATFTDLWILPMATTAGLLAWAAASWSGTLRLWADPLTRARVVTTVASG